MRSILLSAGFLVALLVAGSWSCGARTALDLPDPCQDAGLTRACRDACGEGEERCEDGFWQQCQTPTAVRGCQNACGTGEQGCQAGVWGSCEVAVAARGCESACGPGEELCIDGAWQACEAAVAQRQCESVCGFGFESCRGGSWGACDAPLPKPPKLKATIRDFLASHPDFEEPVNGLDLGMVRELLGSDGKPVYNGSPRTLTTSGKGNFDQWYRNDPTVNQWAELDLQLQPSPEDPRLFVYEDNDFFPIDGQLQGNEMNPRNFHFTLEASTRFEYVGGEVFSFAGDDDMFVFINRRLAIDLGGLHQSLEASVRLDEIAGEFELQKGQTYNLHFFFAERHTVQSNFSIRTSIAEPGSCD